MDYGHPLAREEDQGTPMRMLKEFKRRSLLACQPYILVAESGYYPSGVKRRVITEIVTVNEGKQG